MVAPCTEDDINEHDTPIRRRRLLDVLARCCIFWLGSSRAASRWMMQGLISWCGSLRMIAGVIRRRAGSGSITSTVSAASCATLWRGALCRPSLWPNTGAGPQRRGLARCTGSAARAGVCDDHAPPPDAGADAAAHRHRSIPVHGASKTLHGLQRLTLTSSRMAGPVTKILRPTRMKRRSSAVARRTRSSPRLTACSPT